MEKIEKVPEGEPSVGVLASALRENWSQARHIEQQRAWHFNLYMLALAGVLAIAFRERLPTHQILANYWPLFGFLCVLSLVVFFDVAKENVEISNHMRAVQWIAEKLCLNKKLSQEKKTLVKRLIEEHKLTKEDQKDVTYQGYMALPLPVFSKPMRIFDLLMYLFMNFTTAAFISGFILQFNLFWFLTHLQFPAARLLAYLIGIACGLVLCLYCRTTRRQAWTKARKLLDLREPKGVELRYREEPYFWERK